VHAHRLELEDAGHIDRRAAGRRRDPELRQRDGQPLGLPLLRRARASPRAEAGLLGGSDRLDPLRARARRQRVGVPGAVRCEGPDPSRRPTTTARSSAVSSATFTGSNHSRVGVDNDVRDRLPAHRLDVATHEGAGRADDGRPPQDVDKICRQYIRMLGLSLASPDAGPTDPADGAGTSGSSAATRPRMASRPMPVPQRLLVHERRRRVT
jgi:hypothetical protein